MKESVVTFDLGLGEKLFLFADEVTFRQEREERTHQWLQILKKNIYPSDYPNLDYFLVNQRFGAGILLRGDDLGMTVVRATLGVFVPRKGFDYFLIEPLILTCVFFLMKIWESRKESGLIPTWA